MPRELSRADALAALQALQTRAQVAAFCGVSQSRFDYHLYVRPTPYRRIEIPKNGAGVRVLHAPPDPVRIFQRKLAKHLRDAYPVKRGVHGFCLGGGVVANAKVHVRARILVNLDLSDFFNAITFARVHGMFRSKPFGMSKAAASMLANLCCWNKRLPQGAPTSPMVSNWICRRMDTRLGRLARKHRCVYTRYADDITFSTRRATLPDALVKYRAEHDVQLGDELLAAISSNWFEVNQSKVWVRTMREHQEVTGLVVNEKLNVTRRFRRSLRALLHDWDANGLAHAQGRFHSRYDDRVRVRGFHPDLVEHAGGKLAFLRQVKGPADPLYVRYAIQYEQLRRREGCDVDRPVRLLGAAATRHEFLEKALWVIVARHRIAKTELWNGTGFSLDGVGVVTNAHAGQSHEKTYLQR